MGPRVNNAHLMIEGVVFSFNEARKQFIWLDWPSAITQPINTALFLMCVIARACKATCFLLLHWAATQQMLTVPGVLPWCDIWHRYINTGNCFVYGGCLLKSRCTYLCSLLRRWEVAQWDRQRLKMRFLPSSYLICGVYGPSARRSSCQTKCPLAVLREYR